MSLPFVILASEDDLRVTLFQQALQQQGLPKATLVSYLDFIQSPETLIKQIEQPCILRIDSPGRDQSAHEKLLAAGVASLKSAHQPYVDVQEIQQRLKNKGQIIAPKQYYLGLSSVLTQIQEQLNLHPQVKVINHPEEIKLVFDKYQCQKYLEEQGIPIPRRLGMISHYEELRERMIELNIPRVFIKLRHGSAAAGIIAFEANKQRVQIKTTIEAIENGKGALTLYNTRKIQRANDESTIRRLIDTLCEMEVQVERWIPKAQLEGYNVDLRILMIGGKAQHKVLRMSHSPMTNLHLLNQRGDVALLRKKMSEEAWSSLIQSCEAVAKLFPKSLYIALDVVVSINLKHHFILEVNAFGDLLKGVSYKSLNPQEAEVAQLKNDYRHLAI